MSKFWRKYTLDEYDRRSRLQPALVVALPIVFAALVWVPGHVISWGTLGSLLAYGGGVALLVQIARDRGKENEPWLFDRWGGKPTTRLLRHRDAPNQAVLTLRHRKLEEIISDLNIPTVEEEEQNPDKADEIYDACITTLKERTRDNDLVFEELCNYGFRRNLWGMRPIGILASLFGISSVAYKVYFLYTTSSPITLLITVSLGINILILLAWVFWITPSWVRIAAEAYANQLLASALDAV